MITIKSDREIELLRIAGNIVYETHQYLKQFLKPGITTLELDRLAYDFIKSKGATPSFKNYNGFPASICTSVNYQVVHGIPGKMKLKDGDIISIDIGACYKGYHGDSAWSYPIGKVSKENEMLLYNTEKALFEGLKEVKPGNRIGDISYAIESYAKKHNLGVVKELVGHGVGTSVHEAPDIPNFGKKGTGPRIKKGMVFAIEPMLNLGSPNIVMLDDNWTIETEDYSPSAHFEHTVVVTDDGYEILTGVMHNG
ncbi:MAG: type I methionyl aminopeptidase [bacterium]|nr:type I methionyl aminopeptidase [bacterium]